MRRTRRPQYGIGPDPPERVRIPSMYQRWSDLTFLHWAFDAGDVRSLVPSTLDLDTFDGKAWVALTPFVLERLRVPGVRPLPWLSRFPETNVRTYVWGPDGRRGVWFFSLDAARLPAVVAGRTLFMQPYRWSRLAVDIDAERISYRGRRRLGADGSYDVDVGLGPTIPERDLDELDHFLTARWVLYARYGPVQASAQAEHERWPLRRATSVRVRQDLLQAMGLPAPKGEPLVHCSRGVDVRIGWPRPIGVPRR